MLSITPIPAFSDNYIWMIQRDGYDGVAVVDPGDAAPVLARLKQEGLRLEAILITHHHRDHIGGVQQLMAQFPECRAFGPSDGRIAGLSDIVAEGDPVELPGLQASFQVMEVPGHTSSHIAYIGHGALFCGDTLFAAGCGRVFDGTFEQLSASLRRIAELPAETQLYCAHEYTLDNLGFANWVEPDSTALKQRQQADQALRNAGRPTVPSLLSLELETNPFLRTDDPTVIGAAERYMDDSLSGHAEVFRVLRLWKDNEYD